MNIEQAKGTSLPEILRKLGYLPVKQKGEELLYYSPFRTERTASFNVNAGKNVWYDFGDGNGGDILNFVSKYLEQQGEDNTVADALRWLGNMAGQDAGKNIIALAEKQTEPSETIILQAVSDIEHKGLVNYLGGRGIPIELAKEYLKQAVVLNTKTGKKFNVLCLQNENEGYELRNEVFKGCIVAKGISFIRGSQVPAKEVHIFEGFMDFLSALVEKGKRFKGDTIILNSVTSLPQAFAYLKNYPYEALNSWLDNDKAGALATQTLKEFVSGINGMRFQSKNKTYAPHKDVNEWHVQKTSLAAVVKIS